MTDVGTLICYQQDDCRPFWPEVRADLEAILERYPDRWMPDDIWAELLARNAALWVAGEPGAIEAWCVLQIQTRTYDRSLHVWNASEKTAARVADYWPQIMAIAAANKCHSVSIETPRRYERALPGAKVRYRYEFDVE